MKKLLAILLALLTVLSLVACDLEEEAPSGDEPLHRDDTATTPTQGGNTDNPGTATDVPGITADIPGVTGDVNVEVDFEDIINGNDATNTIWGKQDEATKQQMIAEGKKEGYDVSFSHDGSTTIVDKATGETVVQKPDGIWTIKDAPDRFAVRTFRRFPSVSEIFNTFFACPLLQSRVGRVQRVL